MEKNNFKHIFSGDQFSKKDLDKILELSYFFEENPDNSSIKKSLLGKIIACIFFEPSTRTRLSFETAAHKLGASVISVSDGKSSSSTKGESLSDTLNTIQQYADCIIMRNSDNSSCEIAKKVLNSAFLNAGDGEGEHPTQAILDLFTIKKEKNKISGLKIAFVGDLKYGRTVHSLVKLLKNYDNEFYFTATDFLQIPEKYLKSLDKNKIFFTDDLKSILGKVDVIYMTRIQKERFDDLKKFEEVKNTFSIGIKDLENAKKDLLIMHPLPRVDELHSSLDSHPGMACFRQVKNGVFARMALIALSLGLNLEDFKKNI